MSGSASVGNTVNFDGLVQVGSEFKVARPHEGGLRAPESEDSGLFDEWLPLRDGISSARILRQHPLNGLICETAQSGSLRHPLVSDGKLQEQRNKELVLTVDTLFNKRDYVAAEKFWAPSYMQHSAHIGPGINGLFDLIRLLPEDFLYQPGKVVAEGEYVFIHGRFLGNGRPAAWIAVDILRIVNGRLAEHWDVLRDEATESDSKSGLPMFGEIFPS